MQKGIYKYFVDYGRMGKMECVFAEYDTVIAAAIGCVTDFGDALGKHSNVRAPLASKDLRLLSTDATLVKLFQDHIGDTGHSPIAAIVDTEGGSAEFWAAYGTAYPGHALPDNA